jgi:hypothetical protein
LAEINVRKEVAAAQASVLSEAFKSSEIRILGGDGAFFDRFVQAASMGQTIDGLVNNSETVKSLAKDYLAGDKNLVEEVGTMVSNVASSGENLRDLSLSALLAKMAAGADESTQSKIKGLMEQVQKLGLED